MANKRTTIYLDDQDRQALSLLQDRYGLSTLSDVIRFTLRSMAAEPPQRSKVSQEPSLLDVCPNGSESLPHSPALVEPVFQPVGRALAAGSAPQEEEVVILVEKLQGTQEELVLTQEELARTQEELHQTYQELQRLNQVMLEMSAERDTRSAAMPQQLPATETQEDLKALVALNQQRIAGLLVKFGPLQAEHQRLLRQARTGIAKIHEDKVA